jgi:hypothetical protein
MVGSNPERVKPKTIKLVFAVSAKHAALTRKTDWLAIRIMCHHQFIISLKINLFKYTQRDDCLICEKPIFFDCNWIGGCKFKILQSNGLSNLIF